MGTAKTIKSVTRFMTLVRYQMGRVSMQWSAMPGTIRLSGMQASPASSSCVTPQTAMKTKSPMQARCVHSPVKRRRNSRRSDIFSTICAGLYTRIVPYSACSCRVPESASTVHVCLPSPFRASVD